jgi:hypothetical protein
MSSPPITGNDDLDAFLYNLQLSTVVAEAGTTTTTTIDTGVVNADYYPEQYIQVRYALSETGASISTSPTNKTYYGVYNSITTTASNNPADYTWKKLTDTLGFSTDKFLFYTVLRGRNIKFYIGDSAPTVYWAVFPTTYVDLDIISEGFIDDTDFSTGYEPVAIVNGLPNAATYTGPNIVYDTVTNKMYRWQAGQWYSNVLAADIEGALAYANFSNSLRPVEVVSTLPSSGNFVGRVVLLISDGKIYRYTSTGWTAAVPTVDITGQMTDAQIADLAATKITGQIVGTQITDNAITTEKISAGSITTAKLVANAITANEIAANAIVAGKIAANAVTANEIAANSITTSKLAVDSVTAGVIAAGAITSDKLAANSVIAGKIAAGVVTATEIDSRNLTIKDSAGNIIFGAGNNLDWSRISSQPSGIYNSNITINSDGTLSNAGGGSVSLGGLGAGPFATLSQINSANISTYIASAAIGTAQIGNAAITNALIANAAIGTANIIDGNITAAKIADANITSAKIADANITSAKIADANITSAKIGTAEVGTLKIAGNAVTIPVAVNGLSASVYIDVAYPIIVSFACYFDYNTGEEGPTFITPTISRNGTVVYTRDIVLPISRNFCYILIDNPPIGTNTYTVTFASNNVFYVLVPSLTLLVAKR